MARSTFYYRIGERPDKHASLCKQIEGIYSKHKGRYGYRRVWQTLRVAGLVINRKTVARLMHKMSLFGITPKCHYRSYKGEVGKIAPNVLNRDFAAAGPCEKLTTDISQFVIGDRKLYLSPVLDMWNGEVISYSISHSPNMALVMKMLKKAFRRIESKPGMLLHSVKAGITSTRSTAGHCRNMVLYKVCPAKVTVWTTRSWRTFSDC